MTFPARLVGNSLITASAISSSPSMRVDYQDPLRPLITDTNSNSGTQDFFQDSFSPEVAYRNTPEIVVGMASQGSQVRVFADNNPVTFANGTEGPSVRTSISQLNLQPATVEEKLVVDPNNPLGGYYSLQGETTF